MHYTVQARLVPETAAEFLPVADELLGNGRDDRTGQQHVRVAPLTADQIAEYYFREYKPVVEYGGWGIKSGKGGKVYNTSGNQGVQFVLKDGSKLLIGSQKAHDLAAAIGSVIKGN